MDRGVNRGWLSENAAVMAVKRTVYLAGLPCGALAALLLLWLEDTQGTLHIVDRIGLPLLSGLLVVMTVCLWLRRCPLFRLELMLFGSFSLMVLASFGYSIFELPVGGITNLTGLGYWTSVLYALAFLIFGVRRGLELSLGVYLLALGVWIAEVFVGGDSSVSEQSVLFQIFASNGLLLMLLYGFGVLVQLQVQQAAQLELEANTDALTRIPNRRALLAQLGQELGRAHRYERTFSVVLVDLDHFKTVNDSCGHHAGDETLRVVAQLLQRYARSLDTTGRWGGEEFLLLLPELPLAAACEVAERLRQLLEAQPFSHPCTTTASFGVAEYTPGETLESLLSRADRALYDAKALGRNRVSPQPLWQEKLVVASGLELEGAAAATSELA